MNFLWIIFLSAVIDKLLQNIRPIATPNPLSQQQLKPKGFGAWKGSRKNCGNEQHENQPSARHTQVQHSKHQSAGNRQKILLKIKTSSLQLIQWNRGYQDRGKTRYRLRTIRHLCNKTCEEQNVAIIRAWNKNLIKTSGCTYKLQHLHLRWLMQHDSDTARKTQAEEDPQVRGRVK